MPLQVSKRKTFAHIEVTEARAPPVGATKSKSDETHRLGVRPNTSAGSLNKDFFFISECLSIKEWM